jgi:hypothetical protein
VRLGAGRALAALWLAIGLLGSAPRAVAQAWLPDGGTSSLAITYGDVLNRKHYLPDGGEVDVGHTRSHTVGLTAAWSPSDRLMLQASLPYVRTEYWGSRPHADTHVDDGESRGTLTDLRAEIHWQALDGALALAPYAAVVVPVRDYPVLGHASPGRGLQEVWIGSFGGASLDEWLPGTWFQLRYNYAFVEKVAGIAHDRSNADLELGVFLGTKWSLRGILSWQHSHGGIDVPVPPSDPLYRYHDQLARESFVHVGGGLSWFPSARSGVFATYTHAIRGRNGHKVDHGVNLGFAFSPGRR